MIYAGYDNKEASYLLITAIKYLQI